MTKTDLTITATDSMTDKKTTSKITYVNPNITTAQALDLAKSINYLTKDSYVSTTRTDTTILDNLQED